LIECSTGEAWGLTATRSPAFNQWKYSAVIAVTIEAEEA
jgi:hypothetical protein